MKQYIINLLLIFLLSLANNTLQATQDKVRLSKEATISILTCAPGDELYASFGHTGIRVIDKTNQLDVVFNYGTFDFNTQGFYFKFARGLLPYQLAISRFDSFIIPYIYDKRTVYSQTLLLDSVRKQRLMDLLMENYRPANRSYLYNFMYDNCTTRARDIVQKSTDNKISWTTRTQDKSFWDLLDEYLKRSPWIQWGIHTILGSPANADATDWEQMFLPDYFMYGLDSAYYNNTRLTQPIEVLYQAPEHHNATPWYFSPSFVFLTSTLLLILLLQKIKSNWLLRLIAILFFITTGLIGCLIIFLGFFTAHPTMFPNFNILWANPLNLIAGLFIGKKHIPWLIHKYLFLYLYILLIGFLLWPLFTPAVLLSSMIIFVWMGYLTYRLKRQA